MDIRPALVLVLEFFRKPTLGNMLMLLDSARALRKGSRRSLSKVAIAVGFTSRMQGKRRVIVAILYILCGSAIRKNPDIESHTHTSSGSLKAINRPSNPSLGSYPPPQSHDSIRYPMHHIQDHHHRHHLVRKLQRRLRRLYIISHHHQVCALHAQGEVCEGGLS